jgi:hypothetical protein
MLPIGDKDSKTGTIPLANGISDGVSSSGCSPKKDRKTPNQPVKVPVSGRNYSFLHNKYKCDRRIDIS